MDMFPHTVTLYNVSLETDPATLDERTINHITVLEGVLLDAVKGKNVNESGLVDADSVTLYIPANVSATDGVTGEKKRYVGPVEFWNGESRDGLWTLPPDKTPFLSREMLSTRTGAIRKYPPHTTTSTR